MFYWIELFQKYKLTSEEEEIILSHAIIEEIRNWKETEDNYEMTLETLSSGLDTIWVILTAAMILLMEGGFALLEAGFVRSKNSVNIIMKVFADITIGTLVLFLSRFWIDVWSGLSRYYRDKRVFIKR